MHGVHLIVSPTTGAFSHRKCPSGYLVTAAVFKTLKNVHLDYKYVYNLKKTTKSDFIGEKDVSNESYGEDADTNFTPRILFLSLLIFAINRPTTQVRCLERTLSSILSFLLDHN
jgi:hypothetical protein